MSARVVLIRGDGIGPEVCGAAADVLLAVCEAAGAGVDVD